jgi:excisionase family DNA binding protein
MSKPNAKRAQHRQPDDKKSGGMASVDELAKALGIGRNQAYGFVQSGRIPALRIGRRWLIARPVIERIVSGELLPPAARQA